MMSANAAAAAAGPHHHPHPHPAPPPSISGPVQPPPHPTSSASSRRSRSPPDPSSSAHSARGARLRRQQQQQQQQQHQQMHPHMQPHHQQQFHQHHHHQMLMQQQYQMHAHMQQQQHGGAGSGRHWGGPGFYVDGGGSNGGGAGGVWGGGGGGGGGSGGGHLFPHHPPPPPPPPPPPHSGLSGRVGGEVGGGGGRRSPVVVPPNPAPLVHEGLGSALPSDWRAPSHGKRRPHHNRQLMQQQQQQQPQQQQLQPGSVQPYRNGGGSGGGGFGAGGPSPLQQQQQQQQQRSSDAASSHSSSSSFPSIFSGPDEALRQSHLLKLALERRPNVFDADAGLKRRSAVLWTLERVLARWSDSLRPLGGMGMADRNEDADVDGNDNGDERGEGDAGVAEFGDDDADCGGTDDGRLRRRRRIRPRPRVALISFGSYRLGAHRRNGDIDALALCPPHCTRADFFCSLVKNLKDDDRVTELHPVPGAYTPVLKFKLDGVPIDLLFARLADGEKLRLEPVVGPSDDAGGGGGSVGLPPRDEFLLDDADLVGLDEAGVRSVNGVRVAQFLLRHVPDIDTYRLTLRAVKEWALVRGLYSNVLGFLGGVNWAILVAWICVRNEGAPAPVCLARFFRTFARWKWPRPVTLGQILRVPPAPGVAPLPSWNPRSDPRDAAQLMPIVTPCYPSMNSSYNVGPAQLRRMTHELHRGEKVMSAVAAGRCGWEELFAGDDFFRVHAHYLQVNVMARNDEDFRSWFGLCESRMRILIAGLESPDYGVQCHPFAKFFHRRVSIGPTAESEKGGGGGGATTRQETVEGSATEDGDDAVAAAAAVTASSSSTAAVEEDRYVASFFVALRFAYGVENVDLRSCTEEFLYKVNAWEGRRWGMDLTIEHRTREHLPPFVFELREEEEEVVLAQDHMKECRNDDVDNDAADEKLLNKDAGRGAQPPLTMAEAVRAAMERREAATDPRRLPPVSGAVPSEDAPSPPTNPSPFKRARRFSPE